MPDIVLCTLNARYAHASFGLRYLLANLGPWRGRAAILEFEITRRPLEIVARILEENPRIVGLGVYIWNAGPTTEVAGILKRVRPDVTLVLGGPEISYETAEQEAARLADYVVQGEGDVAFRELCAGLLTGQPPRQKIIAATPPRPADLELPYDLYTETDIAHRVIYVEASRGCPFECEFCLSALDVPVRAFELDRFLPAMQRLLDRGVRRFKFVDRTFNLNVPFARAILAFFLERLCDGLFLHFEMIPDRLPGALRDLIAAFPPGALQFEVGVQTLDDAVSARISRRQDNAKLAENMSFLRESTGVHVHADLIFGLPGETLESIADGFDRLLHMGPQEIQCGILKRLRGTPIVRHTEAYAMIYSPYPPYEVLGTSTLDFATMQRLIRFAKTWELVAQSGQFVESAPLLWRMPDGRESSPFWSMLAFSDRLWARAGSTFALALVRVMEIVFDELVTQRGHDPSAVARSLWRDWQRGGRTDKPPFLKHLITDDTRPLRALRFRGGERQARHRG
jgi:radical SAM superfamily enzyme YgiQ (UPF0313 family)